MLKYDKAMAIAGITILGVTHLVIVGDGTVLGLLMGALMTLAGVSFAKTTDKES